VGVWRGWVGCERTELFEFGGGGGVEGGEEGVRLLEESGKVVGGEFDFSLARAVLALSQHCSPLVAQAIGTLRLALLLSSFLKQANSHDFALDDNGMA